jgi:hypothetical protein
MWPTNKEPLGELGVLVENENGEQEFVPINRCITAAGSERKGVNKRPTLGLKPRYIHEEQRAREIRAAICRRSEAGEIVPVEWIEELGELIERKESKECKCGRDMPETELSKSNLASATTADLVDELSRRDSVFADYKINYGAYGIAETSDGDRTVAGGPARILVVRD